MSLSDCFVHSGAAGDLGSLEVALDSLVLEIRRKKSEDWIAGNAAGMDRREWTGTSLSAVRHCLQQMAFMLGKEGGSRGVETPPFRSTNQCCPDGPLSSHLLINIPTH